MKTALNPDGNRAVRVGGISVTSIYKCNWSNNNEML
ncbi:hypothetical protein SAMN05216529_10284 [Faecalicatena contorta]|uniref:Uncharacterized protein n=1 Tax=Faecalicatena contorta TaxID=39482 RepID=A0A316A130_9FIRM|nr:hypothetical protein A8805_10284 [Faecalicatena contorta]SUQ12869.1 hypothetical protein SAMN05216529_10284 [Faecalicatena contorta]